MIRGGGLQKWRSVQEVIDDKGKKISNELNGQSGTPPHKAQGGEKNNGFMGRRIEYFVKQPAKGIHSEMHALAKEISEFCGEPKKFGMYLGIIKNIGLPSAYRIFAELRQAKEIKTPGKLFLYLSAYKKSVNKKLNGKPKRKTKYGNRKRTGKNTPEKIKKRGKNNAGN